MLLSLVYVWSGCYWLLVPPHATAMVTALAQLVNEAGDEFLRVHREIEAEEIELWDPAEESAPDDRP